MTALIGVDWGTTNLRAFRFADDGTVIDRQSSAQGIAAILHGGFDAVLASVLDGWTDDSPTIIMAGMIGSRNGWLETPYIPCPVDPAVLAAHMLRVPGVAARCWIVPGVSVADASHVDVMRGEETQLLGAGVHHGRVLLPGTHSKWATLAAGRIVDFQTAFTGELHAVLLRHSLLGRLAAKAATHDTEAFARGARRTLDGDPLPTALFSARSEVLLGRLREEQVASYLSGLLIGAEIFAIGAQREAVTIVGTPGLSSHYRSALLLAGAPTPREIDGDAAAAAGLWAIGKALL